MAWKSLFRAVSHAVRYPLLSPRIGSGSCASLLKSARKQTQRAQSFDLGSQIGLGAGIEVEHARDHLGEHAQPMPEWAGGTDVHGNTPTRRDAWELSYQTGLARAHRACLRHGSTRAISDPPKGLTQDLQFDAASQPGAS